MRHLVGFLIGIAFVGAACNKSKPTVTGRLSGPTDLAEYKGCAQNSPACVVGGGSEHHLLLITNSLNNDLGIFDVEDSNFFKAPEPLFPLSIPVGELPVSLAIDPTGQYAFVVNALSQNVSLIKLFDVNDDGSKSNRLVEVDTDANAATTDPGLPDGITRAPLGAAETDLQPEYIVVSQGQGTSLNVYVSLLATGQIAELTFQYPDSSAGTPQRLDLQTETIPVGGLPSGLAITSVVRKLFVANEGSDNIQMVDLTNIDSNPNPPITDISVGGPSRRLALTSDELKLYVVQSKIDASTNTGGISVVVDLSTSTPTLLTTIQIPNVPRSVTFVDGIPLSVDGTNYSPQGTEITHFAWVSNLDGTVYAVDAENNYPVYDKNGANVRFAPTAPGGMAGELISNNFKNTSNPNAKDDFRIFLLYEGSNALMEFFPANPNSTNFLLYQ